MKVPYNLFKLQTPNYSQKNLRQTAEDEKQRNEGNFNMWFEDNMLSPTCSRKQNIFCTVGPATCLLKHWRCSNRLGSLQK